MTLVFQPSAPLDYRLRIASNFRQIIGEYVRFLSLNTEDQFINNNYYIRTHNGPPH